MRTTREWFDLSKHTSYKGVYTMAESAAIWVGRDYTRGELTIAQVQKWLNTTATVWPYRRSEAEKLIQKGVKYAIQAGENLPARTQPVQDEETLEQCKRRKNRTKAT